MLDTQTQQRWANSLFWLAVHLLQLGIMNPHVDRGEFPGDEEYLWQMAWSAQTFLADICAFNGFPDAPEFAKQYVERAVVCY